MKRRRLVVYTAVFGGRDPLRLPPEDRDFDFISFSDDLEVETLPGGIRMPTLFYGDPARTARAIKILPHVFLHPYRYSLWVDGSFSWKMPLLDGLVDEFLSKRSLWTFRHRKRGSVREEGAACIDLRYDAKETILDQIGRYEEEGFQDGAGLAETGVLLREHGSSDVKRFSNLWWRELQRGSVRDQISFPYVSWKTGLAPGYFDGTVDENSLFDLIKH